LCVDSREREHFGGLRQEGDRWCTGRAHVVLRCSARACNSRSRSLTWVDVSRTGVRIRASYEWRAGSEWPLVLELPAAAPVRLTGRVARCEPADVSFRNGAVVQKQYLLAFTFVDLSTDAAAVLDQVCGTAAETGERTG